MKPIRLSPPTKKRNRAATLAGDTRGTAGIEMAFIAPVLMLVLTGMLHFGALFFLQSNMADVARETARRLAVGDITAIEAQQFAQDNLVNWGVTFTVTITPSGNDISVDIEAPMSEAALVDPLGLYQTGTIQAHSTMRQG